MTSKQLAEKLLQTPNLPVVHGDKFLINDVRTEWMHHLYEHTMTWCQSTNDKRSKNCYGCNQKWKRSKVVIVSTMR